MTLRIGELEIKTPFLLAPLAGITDKTMRSLCSEAGASLTYTEMISGKGLWYGDKNTERLMSIGESEGPVGFQLFGSEPEIMEQAVRCLCAGKRLKRGEIVDPEKIMAPEGKVSMPALIDLNAGCPVPKIVRNGEGSALLKDMDRLYDVAKAMVSGAKSAAGGAGSETCGGGSIAGGATTVPVTAKIRIGFSRGENVAVEAAKALEAAGVSAVTVHGRTREQFYEGKADWQAIAEVKAALKIPVIGNGDIFTGADALRMMDETGCDGVMIARGALGNPWIFAEARALLEGRQYQGPAQSERLEMLVRHLDMLTADKGERIAVREMRKHIAWYTKGMHGATALRRSVNTVEDVETMRRMIREFAGDCH
ncbi:MAG: tRNA dihydrouridine synthase DusB [Bacillota bacterium]|nr:tRNA dihydrouridine synthase DusB [Bacillota bacterium]